MLHRMKRKDFMGKSDLLGQFEREVRLLYPEGRASEAERGLLFDLARAKGLSSAEAQHVVQRCLGPSTSHMRSGQDSSAAPSPAPSGTPSPIGTRGEGLRPADGTDERGDTYELSSPAASARPSAPTARDRRGDDASNRRAGRGAASRETSVTLTPSPRPRPGETPDVPQDRSASDMEASWPVSHLAIAAVAVVMLVMVLLLIWRLVT